MSKLIIAGKGQPLAYGALIAASLVNNAHKDAIAVEYVDEKSASKQSKDANAVLNDSTIGSGAIIAALASKYPDVFGTDSTEITHWLEYATKLTTKNFKELSEVLKVLESHLNFRSYIVGYATTAADVAIWGNLRANPIVGSIIKNKVFINVSRWYGLVESNATFSGAAELLTKSLGELRKKSTGGKKEGHKANFDIDLPGAEIGKVVTRFPPEPSGYLHIGHAKAAILNQYFAQAYKGKLIIRFDDTNPSKEKTEFEQSIIEDLELLGIKGDMLTYSSDYFQTMYDLAIKMIKEGKAYCDNTPQEQMRAERMDGIKSAKRDATVEENLRIFETEMKNATEVGQTYCLRAKISFDCPNKALRDPVIYRCNLTPHHRTGTAWKMYPTYDFCVPIVDSIEGVTHALRTIEYRDRNPQYEWMLKALNLRKVHIWDFARVNFVRTLLSKRKLQWFVDKDYVSGWDDPRFPTVRGVRRRGMTVEGLRNFVISQGPSKNIINLDWSLIWAVNKKVIDPVAPRYSSVVKENVVTFNIADGPATPVMEEKPKHKKNPAVGKKPVYYYNKVLIDQADAELIKDGEELTLMDWGNVIVDKVHKDANGIVTSTDGKLHLEGDFRKTEKKITWIADVPEQVMPIEMIDFDHMIVKDKLEEGDNFEDFITPKSEFHTLGYGDVNIKSLKVGDIIQFERKGYFRLDKQASEGKPAVFFTIPDGKTINRYGNKK
ncbi:glutamate--tRNA ligase [Saccharomycopsis crataegensis]|uniref:glutamate--tRNA ligase n=1 Tax=Saccharomycopsis crataegensis TaxID=43959 RepID=A0AAV5QWR7_9ASCO|nr:glutamate--tRNA ligase [Saccharomycopsis crataegensis]